MAMSDEIRELTAEVRGLLYALTMGHAVVTGTLLGILWGTLR